jgi:hypothetical protein
MISRNFLSSARRDALDRYRAEFQPNAAGILRLRLSEAGLDGIAGTGDSYPVVSPSATGRIPLVSRSYPAEKASWWRCRRWDSHAAQGVVGDSASGALGPHIHANGHASPELVVAVRS